MCLVNTKFAIQGLWIRLEAVFVLKLCIVLSVYLAPNSTEYIVLIYNTKILILACIAIS